MCLMSKWLPIIVEWWHRNLQIIDKSHLTQIVCIKCLLARYPGLYSPLSSDWLIQRLHALHWESECLDKCCHPERLTVARLFFWILDSWSWSLLVHPEFRCNTFTQESEHTQRYICEILRRFMNSFSSESNFSRFWKVYVVHIFDILYLRTLIHACRLQISPAERVKTNLHL